MRIIHLGDIVGKSGREAVAKWLPHVKGQLKPDVIIINAENAAHGFGISENICTDLFDLGTHVITTGDHVWDKKGTDTLVEAEPRILRPVNYPAGTPGYGIYEGETEAGLKYAVINIMGRVFMDPLDDPFSAIKKILKDYKLGQEYAAIVIDFHGEATSEKMAFGHFVDGKASVVVGSHTHVPTGDAQILDGGTAYQTDSGMCGDYGGVIGADKGLAIRRFTVKMKERLEPSKGEGTVCGVFVETDDKTGLANRIEPIRLGARLHKALPEV